MTTSTIGPNANKLAIERCAQLMVDRAVLTDGGFGRTAAVAARIADGGLGTDMAEAVEWTRVAIAAIRSAPDCTWTDDEEIAGEILRRLKSR